MSPSHWSERWVGSRVPRPLLQSSGGCVAPGLPMLPSCVPLTRVQACVGVEGHWTAQSPQHGQRRVGECVARKGSGPAARSAGLLSGVARREPAVRGSAEPAGPQGGGATAMSTPGLGGRLPQPGQWGAEPPRRSSPHCPSLLAARAVCFRGLPPCIHKDEHPSICFRVPGAPCTANLWKGLAWALLA